MRPRFAAPGSPAIPLHVVEEGALEGWYETQPPRVAGWLRATGFAAALGKVALVPGRRVPCPRAPTGSRG
jgi:leucyl aminopeptidase